MKSTVSLEENIASSKSSSEPEKLKVDLNSDEPEKPVSNAAKKKGKKKSYKSMMAGLMNTTPSRDLEKEKEALRQVTGGGAFSKIDKI